MKTANKAATVIPTLVKVGLSLTHHHENRHPDPHVALLRGMRRRDLLFLFLFLLLLLSPLSSFAQTPPATGTPPFGSFGGGPDVINLANLNAHLSIPVLHKPGRGTNFTYDLSYDSSVWYPVPSGSSQMWFPVPNFGWRGQTEITLGYISYADHRYRCPILGDGFYDIYDTFVYHDTFGTTHTYVGSAEIDCNGIFTGFTETAADGSAYKINVTDGPSATITSSSGTSFTPPENPNSGAGFFTDRNGNQITVNSIGQFFDTLSSTTPVLTVAGSGTPSSPLTFTYTAPSGANASYAMHYTNYTVATNFGASGISEYKSLAAVPLVTSVVLPDGSQYTFTYEATPTIPSSGACTPYSGTTCVTARVASIQLPTGGTITYSYSGGNNGILPDGTTATLTRTTPDGTWSYIQSKGSSAASATLITAPKLPYDSASNQTILQFQGIYQTQSDVYQGSAPTFTLPISESTLQTSALRQETQTCYNAATSPCTTTAVSLPITQTSARNQLAGTSNLMDQHISKFDAYNNVKEEDDYDFGSGAPGSLIRQTLITYASLGNNLNAFRQTVTVKDGSGNIKSRQDTNYDQYSGFNGANCVTGAPNHDDSGHGCSFTARANATSVTNYTDPVTPGGAITKNFTFDSLGNMRTAQVNCCQQETWAYSTTTSYAYPDSVTSGSSSPQLTNAYTYDLHMGLLLTSTDPNTLKTTLTYDNMGRPLTSTTGTNPAINYTYTDSAPSWTTQVCSPIQGTNTACQKMIADSQGRAVTTQLLDASLNLYSATDTQYDPLGRAYKVSNPYTTSASYWTQTNFDALGRTVKTTLQDSSASTSSYTDNTVTTTDPAAKQRKGVFDSLGRLTSIYEPDPTNGNSLTLQTTYSYNVHNQLTLVTQGSQTRTYAYDALGRLSSSTTPESGSVCLGTLSGSTCQANGYDSWNNLLYRTDARGVVTNYLYDSLNRLVGVTYPTIPSGVSAMPNVCIVNGASSNNANVCLTYGTSASSYNNGLPVTLTDATGSESYTYNAFERLTQVQKVIGGTTYTSSYAYNLGGQLTQIIYPSGRVVAQNFDVIGRLCAVGTSGSTCTAGTTYTTGFAYNAAQQVTGFNYGNSVAASVGYSPDRLQLSSLSHAKSGTTLFGLSYSYGTSGSNDGLISAISDTVQSGRSVSYTYDSLYRLSTALTTGSSSYPQWGLSWTYDRYANSTAETQTVGSPPHYSLTVSATTNQITGSSITYDLGGNMTNDGQNALVYDGENRATSATITGSSSGTYTYDGKGLRVKKVSVISGTSTTTVYIFSGSKVIAEYDNGAAPTAPSREYIYSGAMLTAKIDSSGTHYYHKDLLSNRLVTDSSGNITEQLGHYPYGESWYNSSKDKLLFTSYERDAESGNDYAQARYYVSRLGRFSSPDPLSGSIGNPQSLNRYSYVLNTPTSLVDPTGMDCDPTMIETRRHRKKMPLVASQFGPYALDDADETEQDIGANGCIDTGGGDDPLDGNAGTILGGTLSIVQTPFGDYETNDLEAEAGSSGIGPGSNSIGPTNNPGDDIVFGMDPGLFSSQIGNAFLNTATGMIKTPYCKAMPSGRVSGVNGAAGGIGSASGSFENVVNYNTGQMSYFVSGGLGAGWNGGASGSVFAGYLWGLGNSNANYSGGFTTVSGGAGLGGFISRSSGGLTSSNPSGLLPSSSGVTAVGVSFGASLIPTPTGGVSFTNYSKPFGNINGGALLNSADTAFYLLRRPCQ